MLMSSVKNPTLNTQTKVEYPSFLMRQIRRVNKHIETKKQHTLNIFSANSQLALF